MRFQLMGDIVESPHADIFAIMLRVPHVCFVWPHDTFTRAQNCCIFHKRLDYMLYGG